MKRSILLSLLIIGAVTTLLGSGTLAAFTTFSSDSGVVKAGSIGITVRGSGANTLIFTGSGGNCPDNLFPGNSCSDTVTVTNVSAVPVKIATVTPSEAGALDTCGDGDSLSTSTSPSIIGNILAPGGTATTTVTTTLEAAANASCMGQSATVTVLVAAATP